MHDRSYRGAGGAGSAAAAARQGTPGKRTRVEALQRRGRGGAGEARGDGGPGGDAGLREAAAVGIAGAGGALPFAERIGASFGPAHDLSGVTAHVGGAAATACDDVGATAYASGSHVAFRQAPDLHTAAHEAAHVVQQRGGVQLYGGVGQAGDAYEQHADAVADRVVAGRPAGDLLAPFAGGPGGAPAVQRYGGGGGGGGAAGALHDVKHPAHAGAASGTADAGVHVGAAKQDGSLFSRFENLGVFDTMLALQTRLVSALYAYVPQKGDALKLELEASVCVEGIYAKVGFDCKVENGQDGFVLAGATTTMIGIGEAEGSNSAELGICTKKELETVGRTPEVCILEIALYIDTWLRDRQWTPESFRDPHKWVQLCQAVFSGDMVTLATMVAGSLVADLIFGRGFKRFVGSQMAVGDHVESSHMIGVGGGFKLGNEKINLEAEGTFGYVEKLGATKLANGDVAVTNKQGMGGDASIKFTCMGVSVKGSVEGFKQPSDEEWEYKASLTLEADMGKNDYVRGALTTALDMAKIYFAYENDSNRQGANALEPITAAFFGDLAHGVFDTCLSAAGVFNRVGIVFSYSGGKDVVVSIYAAAAVEAETGIVNVSTRFTDLQEVARIPV